VARSKLESAIQRDVKKDLESRGWHVEVFTCNAYQKGIPDLYAYSDTGDDEGCHRWIDIKRPKGGTLTKCQCQKWPIWEGIGLGVWILTGPGQEEILFGPPNFREWWKPRYDKYEIRNPADILRDELDVEQCNS
jgi:hypothetical protein